MKASALGFKHVVVRYDMFGFEFECIIGPKKNVAKYVVSQFDDDRNQDALEVTRQVGKCYFREGYAPIVWVPRFPRTPAEYGTLSHEVSHAITYMLDSRCISINSNNDETFCYALGYGVKKILEAKR